MKKLLLLGLTLAMAFTMAACGGGDDKSSAEDAAKKAVEQAEEFESFSVEAVEHYLKSAVNMELTSVAPDWEYTIGEKSAYADDPSSGYGHAVVLFSKKDGEVTSDEYQAWLQKVFDATAKASQDGYNIVGWEFVAEGEDPFKETTLDEAMDGFLQGWCFRVNDKSMTVYVSQAYDNDKESEIGEMFYYYGVKVDIGVGLQKSFDDTMSEAAEYLEENEDEVKEAIDDYLN